MEVARRYMKEHNKTAKTKTNVKRITINEALAHIEPIMFQYRRKQFEGNK